MASFLAPLQEKMQQMMQLRVMTAGQDSCQRSFKSSRTMTSTMCMKQYFFFRLLPSKSIGFKGELCTGGQLSKNRLTVFVGANMSGSDKFKLFVIRKYKNPRCFKGITTVPSLTESNSRAWMTQALFSKCLHTEDAQFSRQNGKVIFFVDNCPGHETVTGLKYIQLKFLPANITALFQPMDQEVLSHASARVSCIGCS